MPWHFDLVSVAEHLLPEPKTQHVVAYLLRPRIHSLCCREVVCVQSARTTGRELLSPSCLSTGQAFSLRLRELNTVTEWVPH